MGRIIISILLILISLQSYPQIGMFHAHNQSTIVTPPLDIYTGAAWAVSVRKIRTAYTGYCMKVRRASDNTTQDIGFDSNGLLDVAAITSFCAGTDGFVHTWYDQSGNGLNWVQTTDGTQPYIAISGIVTTINGLPSVRQFGIGGSPAKRGFTFTSTGSSTSTMFQVALQHQDTPEGATTYSGTVLSEPGSEYCMLPISGSGSANYSGAGTPSFWINGVSKTMTTRAQAATEYIVVTGYPFVLKLLSITNLNLSTWTSFETMRFSGASLYGDHFISERIMYYTDKSSDRVDIETNLNSYYTIY